MSVVHGSYPGFQRQFDCPPALKPFQENPTSVTAEELTDPHVTAPFAGYCYAFQDGFTLEFPSEISTGNSRQASKTGIFGVFRGCHANLRNCPWKSLAFPAFSMVTEFQGGPKDQSRNEINSKPSCNPKNIPFQDRQPCCISKCGNQSIRIPMFSRVFQSWPLRSPWPFLQRPH